MNQDAIFFPFFGVMLLTLSVWIYMYFHRLSYLIRERVDPDSVATTRQVLDKVPDKVITPSENFVNLTELPVLFYAICIYLYLTQQVDSVYMVMAYGFLLFRIVHSIIHCTYNKVKHRFYSYMLSAFILWAIIIRAFVTAIFS